LIQLVGYVTDMMMRPGSLQPFPLVQNIWLLPSSL